MERPKVSQRAREAVPRSAQEAFVTIERRIGAPRLFATAYSTVGSSIYFALGVVAAYALGLTPLVFLIPGLLFVLTTLTYFEGMTVHPERGGSAVMARYAFNEFVSFIAGWAILLDYLILIAISSISIGHYLAAFWPRLGEQRLDLLVNHVPNRTPQQYGAYDKPPRRGSDCGLRVQRDKGETLMLEQEPARPVLQNVTSADPRHT